MKQHLKSAFVFLFRPRLIVFGLALYNFITIWIEAEISSHLGALVDPWFKPWSYLNEPSLLLLSAALLLSRKWWIQTASFLLSGSVLVKGIYLITKFGWSKWLANLSSQWRFNPEYHTEILKEWEIQLALAVIVFGIAVVYLFRDILGQNISRNRFI